MAEFKITREKLREEYTRKMRSEQLSIVCNLIFTVEKQVENESVQSKQLKEMNVKSTYIFISLNYTFISLNYK